MDHPLFEEAVRAIAIGEVEVLRALLDRLFDRQFDRTPAEWARETDEGALAASIEAV